MNNETVTRLILCLCVFLLLLLLLLLGSEGKAPLVVNAVWKEFLEEIIVHIKILHTFKAMNVNLLVLNIIPGNY